MTTLVHGRGGLGDAIYGRPFVRAALARYGAPVHVQTSWPWVFSDLQDVYPVKRMGGLKVQAFHGELVPPSTWTRSGLRQRTVSLRYRWGMLARKVSVADEMETMSRLRVRPALDLPPLPPSPVPGTYAVVRPPAVRCDFPAPAREPDPAYLLEAAKLLQAAGVPVITVGYWIAGLEEPAGEVPADVRYEHGELALPELFALIAGAALVVSAPCYLVPACLATRTRLVIVGGGCGGRNSPDALVDPRQDTGLLTWLLPDDYCMCAQRHHDCPKRIGNFRERFELAAGVGVAA